MGTPAAASSRRPASSGWKQEACGWKRERSRALAISRNCRSLPPASSARAISKTGHGIRTPYQHWKEGLASLVGKPKTCPTGACHTDDGNSDPLNAAKSRRPYLLLLLVFAVSRILYYALGVRFDARPLLTFYQIIDPELLRHRLLESLYYLHAHPPGFNLYAGILLKLFPDQYAIAFHALHLILGAATCCLLYHLMRACGVHAAIAFVLSALFIVSPGVVL